MISIDWGLLALMLAGTASLSATLGLLLGCGVRRWGRRSGEDAKAEERNRR